MKFTINQAIEVLSRTPSVLRSMLEGLSEPWIRNNYGEKTFSPFDVVGHLLHGDETDWMSRVHIILEQGESMPFPPFDRYAMYEKNQGKPLAELLDAFEQLRRANLTELRKLNLSEEQLSLRGTHPALGRVTLGELLATWVVHDLNHIHQIAKCMAHQYAQQVGPWKEYLTILPR